MAGLVIEALVGPQTFQQSDGPGGKQAVGAEHHQNDRHKEQHQGVHRVPGGEGDGIAPQQRRQPQDCQQPFRFRFPLSGTVAVEQFNGPGPSQAQQVP